MLLTILLFAATLAAGDPCAVPTGRDARICSERVGHCFDLEINGQRVEFLQDAALRAKLTDALESKAVCWMLPKPIIGDLDIVPRANEHTAELGELRKGYEIVVTALEGLKMSVKFKHVDEQLLLKTAAESVGLVIHEKT